MSVFWVVVISAGLYVFFKLFGKSSEAITAKTSTTSTKRQAINNDGGSRLVWLDERWALAERQRGAADSIFPTWYFDAMTDRQSSRLTADGQLFSAKLTKGQASDLIGLKEPAEDDDLQVLKYFKCSTRGMNKTRARHEVALLFQSVDNQKLWEMRPASLRQKEFFRFFKIKPQASITKIEAEKLINTTLMELQAISDIRIEHWSTYENILDEFDDPEFRDSYDLKKPSYSQIREAVDFLLTKNHKWSELEDVEIVVECLIEMRPDLVKDISS